jgi:hypothetical protein
MGAFYLSQKILSPAISPEWSDTRSPEQFFIVKLLYLIYWPYVRVQG